MIICVASGKGGTGKTTVAVNLAASAAAPVQLLDCDVEEPNAHLFLRPHLEESFEVHLEVPEIRPGRCTFCGKCQEICQFNAIGVLPEMVLTFPELCHGCGGCFLVCPEGAITPGTRILGWVERGWRDHIRFVHGRLRLGEAMAPPLIRRVKQEIRPHGLTILDAPPGISCPVVTTMRGSDLVLLVSEPTPFGLYDLGLTVEAVRQLQLPTGLVINRADLGDRRIHEFASREGIPLLLEIPFERQAAEAYAQGRLLVETLPHWRGMMQTLWERIRTILPAADEME